MAFPFNKGDDAVLPLPPLLKGGAAPAAEGFPIPYSLGLRPAGHRPLQSDSPVAAVSE